MAVILWYFIQSGNFPNRDVKWTEGVQQKCLKDSSFWHYIICGDIDGDSQDTCNFVKNDRNKILLYKNSAIADIAEQRDFFRCRVKTTSL